MGWASFLCLGELFHHFSEFGSAPSILSSACSMSWSISKSSFNVKLFTGLTASRTPSSFLSKPLSSFVLLSLSSLHSSGCTCQVSPASWMSASPRSACLLGVLLLITHLVKHHMGLSLWDRGQHHRTICGLLVARVTDAVTDRGGLWKQWCAGCWSWHACHLHTDCGPKS